MKLHALGAALLAAALSAPAAQAGIFDDDEARRRQGCPQEVNPAEGALGAEVAVALMEPQDTAAAVLERSGAQDDDAGIVEEVRPDERVGGGVCEFEHRQVVRRREVPPDKIVGPLLVDVVDAERLAELQGHVVGLRREPGEPHRDAVLN